MIATGSFGSVYVVSEVVEVIDHGSSLRFGNVDKGNRRPPGSTPILLFPGRRMSWSSTQGARKPGNSNWFGTRRMAVGLMTWSGEEPAAEVMPRVRERGQEPNRYSRVVGPGVDDWPAVLTRGAPEPCMCSVSPLPGHGRAW